MNKILLVDDSPFALRQIGLRLELVPDCEVLTADSAEKAIELIPILKPDLILTDNQMGDMSGAELCAWVKGKPEFRHIFICILTAEMTEIEHKIHGLELGADDYLLKSVPTSELVAKINSFLRLSRLQRNLKEAIEMRDRFFSFIVHELRTPLTAILGYIQFCQMGTVPEPTRKDYLDKIGLNARRILETVNDILEISRLEAGKMSLELSEFDLAEVARGVVEEQEILAKKKGLEIINEIPSTPVYLDRNIFKTILNNFFNNAIKYTAKGSIRLWLEKPEEGLLKLGVTDTGPGIARDYLPHVFDAFSREKRATKKIVGTGIGMSLCKMLIEAMGGTIHVESGGVNQGTTFFVQVKTRLESSPPSLN